MNAQTWSLADGMDRVVPTFRPLLQRAPRVLAAVALSLAISTLLTIVLLAKVPSIRHQVLFGGWSSNPEDTLINIALFVILAVPLWVVVDGLRHRWLTWRVLAVAWALVLGTMAYLAHDDPVVNRPTSPDEFSPALPGDAASAEIVLRFSQNRPGLTWFNKTYGGKRNAWMEELNGNARDADILRQHRDEIEADWNEMPELRQWWADMAAQPRLGDLTRDPSDPLLAYNSVRAYSLYACVHAELLALDGHGDEALAILCQTMDVGQKLSATSRTALRWMIALASEKMALASANFELDHAETSPAARAAFAATLAAGSSGGASLRRIIMAEYAFSLPIYLDRRYSLGEMFYLSDQPSIWKSSLDLLRPLLMNPRATANLAAAYYSDVADLAAKRDLDGMTARVGKLIGQLGSPLPLKNAGGRAILAISVPSLSLTVPEYWQVQDTRAALLARLQS
jgi:hypothetical protein